MASHAYWRVSGTLASNGPTDTTDTLSCSALAFRSIPGGPNLAVGGTAIAKDSFSGYPPSAAFDGNPATFWSGALFSFVPTWLGYGFTSLVDIQQFTWTDRGDGNILQNPTAMTLDYSDDGITWTTRDSFIIAYTAWTVGATNTFTVSVPTYPPFPTFNGGVVSGLDGYREADLLYSTVETLDSGYGNAHAWTSYYDPATKVFYNFQECRFSIAFPMFTQAEVAKLEAFWNRVSGPYGYFTFKDDQGITWPHCQFDQETLEFDYLGPNQYSVECKILSVPQYAAQIPPRPLPNPPPTPPPPPPAILSATLIMLTSYTSNVAGKPAGSGGFVVAVARPSQGTQTWVGLYDGSTWTRRTDTFNLAFPSPTTLTGIQVTFTTDGSLNQDGFADFFIYDVHLHVVYTNNTAADIYPISVAPIHIGADGGTLENTGFAIDGNLLTAAELTRIISRSLLSDFTSFTVAWA